QGVLRMASGNGKKENVVALCDVDAERASAAFQQYPKASRYKDFRRMLEEQKDIDAVIISTPDHTHAVATMAAMQLGKHVYVEKPLTHNIREARILKEAAERYGVVTQMGNQGASGDGVRRMKAWVKAGIIGDVHQVYVWTNRPVWPQGIPVPEEKMAVPDTLDWDLWLGPAAMRPYHPTYLPFNWRGWWDFGTGALGDMGCHLIDPAFIALDLGTPIRAEASTSQQYSQPWQANHYPESCPASTIVHLDFEARGDMPPVRLSWYDGGLMPPRPEWLKPGEPMGDDSGGCIIIGERGGILCGTYGSNPTLLPTSAMEGFQEPEPDMPPVPEGHQRQWVEAIKEGGKTSSPFDYASALTETILVGNLAIHTFNRRVLRKGKKPSDWDAWEFPGRGLQLEWDSQNLMVTNLDDANEFVGRDYREGWKLMP
ncbi:MAG: Gfo/Idh/MocA family oxidoreductase, partial [Saprospiraceae bacterium]|nr:Gfo/Idh/MocA family oxidoreductase [Saprospiraceae bacterium]